MREWIRIINDPAADPYERRFRLFAPIGVITVAIWLAVISFLDFDPVRLLFFVAALGMYTAVVLWSAHTGQIQPGSVLCVCGMEFVLMPFVFLREGGIYAGAFNYGICSLIFIMMTLQGKMRMLLVITDFLAVSVCFLVSYLRPEWLAAPERDVMFVNAYTEMIIPCIMALASLMFQLYMFRQERMTLQAQKNEIEELNRSQNRFFSSMSHEIRTPINTIIGLNEMNMREQNISDEVYTNNRNIQGASNMLLALINDILDMSKIESGKMDIVPVAYETGTMLSEIVNMIWGRANGKGLQFSVEVDPALPVRLYGDEVRIKQVLINLLNNAVKYTQEGSIRLQIQCDRIDNRHARVTYRVEDTGMGIKKEALPDLFDAFKRVDQEKNRNIEGTGLGLSIVKQIVDLMDGEITVDSVYTKGSTFSVSFTQEIVDEEGIGELSLSASKTAAKRDVYLQSFEAPTATLLIVDDNELNLQVESKLLEATKMQIELAMSGRECLSMTFRKKYDVIFMDHLMPGMDGIETLHEIRAQRGGLNRDTKVLVLTANAGSENQALYAREGFDGYLVKPVTGEQLESTLLSVLPQEKVNRTGAATLHGDREMISGQHKATKRILVTCESGADLPTEVLRRYRVPVINFSVRTDKSVFYDNRDIEAESLIAYLDDPSHVATSLAPSIPAFERFFAERLSEAQHVVHIALGKDISHSFENASQAAASFGNVEVVDSGHLSSGTGLLVLYALHLSEQEENVQAFLEQVERVKQLIGTNFVVDKTDLLARNGRITGTVHALMRSMMLHPVLVAKKSAMHVGGVMAGESGRYRRAFVRRTLRKAKRIDTSLLLLSHAAMTEAEVSDIIGFVKEEIAFKRILTVKSSSAMSANGGRGSFGLFFATLPEDNDREEGMFDFLPVEMGKEKEEEMITPHPSMTPHPSASPTPSHQGEGLGDAVRPQGEGEIEATGLHKLYDESGALDYASAMEYLASEDLMEKTLHTFYDNIGKNATEIEQFLNAEDFENFTIKVHALKSSARLVGAADLSEMARRLEEYGDFIRS